MTTFVSKCPNEITSILIGTYCIGDDFSHTVTVYYVSQRPQVLHLNHSEIFNLLVRMGYNINDVEISHYIPDKRKCCTII